jgi:hypothetical protein
MMSSIIKKSTRMSQLLNDEQYNQEVGIMPQLLNDEQYNQEVDTDVATAR